MSGFNTKFEILEEWKFDGIIYHNLQILLDVITRGSAKDIESSILKIDCKIILAVRRTANRGEYLRLSRIEPFKGTATLVGSEFIAWHNHQVIVLVRIVELRGEGDGRQCQDPLQDLLIAVQLAIGLIDGRISKEFTHKQVGVVVHLGVSDIEKGDIPQNSK
jgi:hypothetical protein